MFYDRLTLDKARRNADGYMAIHARAARTGVYQYLGREIDPEGAHFAADQIVNVYRPPEEVFDKASLGSFVGKPITDDHPAEGVNANNWRDLARGTIMSATRDVADDGEYVGFDLAFMDADLIASIESGKRELSNGYAADLDIADGVAPCGTKFQAVQRNQRGNHVAVVTAGRAGSACRIGDAAACAPIPSDEVRKLLVDQRTYDAALDGAKNDDSNTPNGDASVAKIITIDGMQVDIANVDTAAATIATLQQRVADANARAVEAEAQVATLTTDNAKLEAEKTTLEQKVEDSKVKPADLRDAAKRYADTVAKAEALDVTVEDSDDEPAIMRKVVDAKLGDKAEGWNDAQVAASFASLTADLKPGQESKKAKTDKLTDGLRQGGARKLTDASAATRDARQQFLARKESAYLADHAAN